MPRNAYYGSLAAQVTAGTVPVDVVNAAVRRILNIKQFFGQLDAQYRTDTARQSRPVNEDAINKGDAPLIVYHKEAGVG